MERTVLIALWLLLVQLRWLVDGSTSAPSIQLKDGRLLGMYIQPNSKYKELSPVQAYLGIRYAAPPVGRLRFMPPTSPPRMTGIHNATTFGSACPQKLPDIKSDPLSRMPVGRLEYLKRLLPLLSNQDEDCLFLNIYVPTTEAGVRPYTRYPVIMFIHGESYEWGSGNPYDGSVITSLGDVIFITINYRLGILGFLSTSGLKEDVPTARGNYGLLDQIAALHWINQNINYFGGNADDVTIMGHGHGAASVNLLMLSPVAQSLFRRAIVMSGSSLSNWAIVDEPYKYALQAANALDCSSLTVPVNLTCLQRRPVEDFLDLSITVPTFLSAWGPSVDGRYVTRDPRYLMTYENSRFGKYDLLFGVAKEESYSFFNANKTARGIEDSERNHILRTFVRNLYTYHQNELYAAILNEYTDWDKPAQHQMDIRVTVMDVLTDALYASPVLEMGQLHSMVHLDTYLYVFSYQTKRGDYPEFPGCIHGEELPYLFGAPVVDGLRHFRGNYTRQEKSLSEMVIKFWTNFAKTGDPNKERLEQDYLGDYGNGKVTDAFGKMRWPQYDRVHQKYVSIGVNPRVRSHYRAHKVAFWTKLVPQLNKPGGDPVSPDHHLLTRFNDLSSFEGNIRSIDISIFPPTPAPPPTIPPIPTTRRQTVPVSIEPPPAQANNVGTNNQVTTSNVPPHNREQNNTETMKVEQVLENTYSTALSVTIAVGCSLLILNVLIFAGVYYQWDKKRLQAKMNNKEYELSRGISDEMASLQYTPRHHQTSNSNNRNLHQSVPPAPPPPGLRQHLYTQEATV